MLSDCKGDDVMSKSSSDIINEAIFNLETFGRHHCGKVQINHDRAHEQLLRDSVAVLEAEGMMNHLKLFLIGLCVSALVFLLTSCANQPVFCPEVKINFCPVK